MYRLNPEEFIAKVSRLINEQKATMIVDDITYDQTDGTYDAEIFTAEKNKNFSKAYLAKKNVQDYVFADGTADKSVERRFAEDIDLDDQVVVYAKLPRGFQMPRRSVTMRRIRRLRSSKEASSISISLRRRRVRWTAWNSDPVNKRK